MLMSPNIVIDYGVVESEYSSKFEYDTFYIYSEDSARKIHKFDTLNQCLMWCDSHTYTYRITPEAQEMNRVLMEEETERYYKRRMNRLSSLLMDKIIDLIHNQGVEEDNLSFSKVSEEMDIYKEEMNRNMVSDEDHTKNFLSMMAHLVIYSDKEGLLKD